MALTVVEVYGAFVGVAGEPLPGVSVSLLLDRPIRDGVSGELYAPQTVSATSDALGEVSLSVVSNQDVDATPANSYYKLKIGYPGGRRVQKAVSVPDLELVSLWDLLEIEPGPDGDGNTGPAGPQGPRGVQGPVTVGVGTTATGGAGTAATVENTGTSDDVVLDFTVPKGDTGAKGDQGIQGDQGLKGDQGDQGLKGDQGVRGLTYRGAWAAATSYAKDDAVEHLGSAYVAVVAVAADVEPPAGDWSLLTAKGEQGIQGAKGDQGVKGDTGDIGAQWQGAWVAGTYGPGDLVGYDGSTFLTNAETSAEPPAAPWELVAEAGADGAGSPSSALSPSVDAASQTGAVGASGAFAREDHEHPSGAFEAGGAVAAHESAEDPHPGYLTETEGNAAYAARIASVAALTPTTGAVAVDMDADDIYTHALTGDPTYSTVNRVNGSSVLVRVDAGGADRSPTFPAGWVWLTEIPATFTSGKTGLLSLLVAGGTAESDVVASFVEES